MNSLCLTVFCNFSVGYSHRLNMEVDLQSLFGLHVTWCALHSCTHWLRPRNSPPSPRIWIRITRAFLVSQDRRHLFVTPWLFSLFVIPFLGLCCRWHLHNVQGKELSEQASKYKKEARKLLEEKEKSGKSPIQTKSKPTFRGSVLSHIGWALMFDKTRVSYQKEKLEHGHSAPTPSNLLTLPIT